MKKQLPFLLILLAFFLSGCRASMGSVERETPEGTAQVVEDKRIIPDRSLRGKIEIIRVNEGIVSGDLTKIQVVLANRKSTSRTVNYAWEWYDMDGMQVNSSALAWKSLRLVGKERSSISAIGPTPQSVDFVLKLQEPRPFRMRNKLNPFTP